MDLDTFIIAVFCLVDDAVNEVLAGRRLRQRGPQPALADSEVLTMEIVGEYLGLCQDVALFRHFRRHHPHFFPALKRVDRTTFVRQAANLWRLKERVWRQVLTTIGYDPSLGLVDSFPLAVCRFARAPRCRRFRGEAAFGKDLLIRQTFYGLRVHMRVAWPGVITSFGLAPANVHEQELVPYLAAGTQGLLLGDRNYWAPALKEALRKTGVELLAPYRWASRDPQPRLSRFLNNLRRRIDTVFSQLTDRYQVKRLWARDMWHLVSRLLRKVLSHTIAFLLNQRAGHSPMRLAAVLQ